MFKRILVPTDFSEASRTALEVARQSFPGAEIKLLHVIDEDTPPCESCVREQLEALGGGEFVYGNPAEQMMEMVKQWGADLIVMSVSGQSGLGGPYYTSVAEWMVRESPVPVMTVKTPPVRA